MQNKNLRDKIEGSLWGLFIGDSLSMPVHWYYNPGDIIRDFGKIKNYEAPKQKHPSSIMNLHSTGKGGRGGQSSDIIGRVILKGKQQFWGKPQTHYHQGMQAGDNTLNALCTRVLLRSINEQKKYDPKNFLENYVKFMTTKDSHNDTYAESYHRDFFNNYDQGKDLMQCAGEEGHDTPSMGGLVTLPPVIIQEIVKNNSNNIQEVTKQHLFLTHKSKSLESYSQVLQQMFQLILNKEYNSDQIIEFAQNQIKMDITKYSKNNNIKDTQFIGQMVSSACYIDHSFPALLYLLSKYGNNLEQCLLANANAGGENCHRGAVLGSLIGGILGKQQIPQYLIDGLKNKEQINKEINDFIDNFQI